MEDKNPELDEWRPLGILGDLSPGELNDGCCWACSGGVSLAVGAPGLTTATHETDLSFVACAPACVMLQGDVVCCDGCRAVFHLACLDMQSLPDADFYCPLCTCKQCQRCVRTPHPALCVETHMLPVHTKTLPVSSVYDGVLFGAGCSLPAQTGLMCTSWPRRSRQPAGGNTHNNATITHSHACLATCSPFLSLLKNSPGRAPSPSCQTAQGMCVPSS